MGSNRFSPKMASLGDACCGCGACRARCPKLCISMEPDSRGFLHPSVNISSCIGCRACDAVCPALKVPREDGCESVLWAKAKDIGLLDRSSSGGIFCLLAHEVLSRGGVVAGAAWGPGCRELSHVLVERESDLDAVMRSKYVQSSIGREVYEGIRDVLRDGRPVLFSGTACQVAGMRLYLGRLADSDLFFGVDVICHGVPSPELWRRWLGYVENREVGEVYNVNFRSKTTGWSSYSIAYDYLSKEDNALCVSSNRFTDDWYMKAFLQNASLRSSCFKCSFKRRCGSDLTLGDYWGIQNQHSEVYEKGGVSAIVANTDRGVETLESIAGSLDFGESSLEKIICGNPSLIRPVRPYVNRDAFMSALADGMSVSEMMVRWSFAPELGQKIFSKIRNVMKKLLSKE